MNIVTYNNNEKIDKDIISDAIHPIRKCILRACQTRLFGVKMKRDKYISTYLSYSFSISYNDLALSFSISILPR